VHENVASLQTVGGTGACHMGAAFLKSWYHLKPDPSSSVAYVSDPSWENHHDVFRHAGIETTSYPYWDAGRRNVDFDGMRGALEEAPTGSIIVLHACGHNPTGMDLSSEQWEDLSELMKGRSHFAFFDSAYQGFVSGHLQEDNG
jgi:aspartate aminotransferase